MNIFAKLKKNAADRRAVRELNALDDRALQERLGKLPTVREVYRNFRDVNAKEAEYILKIINESRAVNHSQKKEIKIPTRPKME